MTPIAAVALSVAISAPGAEPVRESDVGRSSWAYRRDVTVTGTGEFAAVSVPLDVARRGQSDLRDVRLVTEDGTEIPYVVDRAAVAAASAVSSWAGRLADFRRESKSRSVWVVDLGGMRTFDRIDLEIGGADFAKRLQVDSSDDGKAWRGLVHDAGVFDREWSGRLRHTFVELDRPARTAWLRLTANDTRSRSIDVTGVRVSATRRAAADEWREAFTATLTSTESGASRYRLDVPPGTPLEAIVLDCDDPAFSRAMTLYDVRTTNGRREERWVGEKQLYRLRLPDEALAVEDLRLPVASAPAGELTLVVKDGDSPPLRRVRGLVAGAATRLLFPVPAQRAALYYGNSVTRAALYDIDALRSRLTFAAGVAPATLGVETHNPRFAPPAPLPMVATAGAKLDAARWRWSRALPVDGREDIFTLRLAAEDVAAAREDLGDVRIVDGDDRQVPFVLERDAAETRVDLVFEPVSRSSGDPRRRVLRLRPPAERRPETLRLPVRALEIDVADAFFSRTVRVYAPPAGGRERRAVTSQVLTRRDESADKPRTCRIDLDGGWYGELELEIDEGDNGPLTIGAVRAVVKVPRLAFKAKPGRYRLLLGNDGAGAPQYDLASLRREVLAYSAVATEPGALEAHGRFRRTGRDYLKQAPPALFLWGALLAAVAGLVVLTLRILRTPAV